MVRRKDKEQIMARILRKMGKSVREIERELHVSRSSVSIWVRDVDLTKEQRRELADPKRQYHLQSEETKKKLKEIQKERAKDPKIVAELTNRGQLTPRKLEVLAKPIIEERFKTQDLIPAKIGGRYFDFVNMEYIIEFTIDKTAGISNAIRRFESIKQDARQKILIAPNKYFGKIRRLRLMNANAKFIPLWF